MKKRRGILFALGIVLTLSVAVPAVAAENVTGTTVTQDSAENEQEQEAPKENSTDAAQIPQIQDEEKSADAAGAEKEVTPTWEKHKTDGGEAWRLKLGESTDPDNDGYAHDTVYTNDGKTYCFNEEGDMTTGYVKVDASATDSSATDPSAVKLDPGLYYFSKEGNDPSTDTLGSMLKDCWAQEADENGAWHYLGSDGKAVNTGEKAGWQQPEEDWYYLKEDGTIDTSKAGWVQIENVWMKAGKGVAAIQKAGWYQIENRWYMLKNDGSRDTSKVNWQQINGNWYFLKADGSRDTSKTGMQTGINGKTYFLNAEGVPQNGFQTVNGVAYYFDVQAGTARQLGNNWQQMNGSWYWIENGRVATGWRAINGKWYYLNPADGRMLTGFYKDATGQLFYSDGSGAMLSTTGWYLMNGTWYWVNGNGSLATGWINVGGTWYYMGENGAMKTGWYQVNGAWYYSNGSGAMQTGWLNRGGTWYYLTGSGAMVEGWAYIGGSWYYMVPGNGAMVGAGWHLIDNSWYYMNGSGAMCSNRWIGNYYVGGSGAMLTNTWVGSYWVGADGNWIPNYDPDQNAKWVQDGNTWYYQRTDGSRITNSWKKINGTWYYFAGSGAMLTGWNVVGGSWYFFNGSGAMQTGWGQVDGSWYYFGGDGAMKTGWINDGKRNYYLKPNGVWKNILIGVIGNNEAGAATTAAKVREMGVDAVIVTGGYDPSQYDGIIIPGGGDLDPSRYGQANTGSSNIDNVLDDRQIDAVKRSAEAGKPVLGICKGIQLVNVAFGGTLNQNIGGHMGVWHSAHVVAGGWLSGVYSGSVSVLSYHHQSIRDLAPGFQVDMRAGDGTVEAISNSAKRVYGVQFHPEQMNNDAGNRCMKQFVAICTN